MRCTKHDLAVAPDGLCIVCRREAQLAAGSARPPQRLSTQAPPGSGSGGVVAGLVCVLVGLSAFGLMRAMRPADAAERPARTVARAADGAEGATTDAPRVVVYSTSWCGSCKQAKAWLRREGIPFVDHDVENDEEAAREYRKLGIHVVPVIVVDDEVIRGFDPRRIERALARPH